MLDLLYLGLILISALALYGYLRLCARAVTR